MKPENILVDENDIVKIADFGVAYKLKDPKNDIITGSEGTDYFMSPECCQKQGSEGYSGKASDIWSLGIILYTLITNKVPFVGTGAGQNQKMNTYELIINAKYPEIPILQSHQQLAELLRKLLEKDAKKRIDMEGIKKHPFMTKTIS